MRKKARRKLTYQTSYILEFDLYIDSCFLFAVNDTVNCKLNSMFYPDCLYN